MRELFMKLWNDSAFFAAFIRGAIFIIAAILERENYITIGTREMIQGGAIMLPAGQRNDAPKASDG